MIFWEYLETKSAIIYTNIFSPKNEINTELFPNPVAKYFIIGDLTKIIIVPLLHEAVTVPEKKLRAVYNFKYDILAFSRDLFFLICLAKKLLSFNKGKLPQFRQDMIISDIMVK